MCSIAVNFIGQVITGDWMKTIREPKGNVAQLWQRPMPVQSVYRPMKYLLRAPVEEGLLLYNVVTSEMLLLDKTEAKFFDEPTTAYDPAMAELITRRYLVPEDFDEGKSVQQLREIIRKLRPAKRVSGFTILPTTECNARCYYCFESDHPRCTMTDRIADDTVAYIADKCKGEPVEITWFGGEPLVGAKQINRICAGLREREIKYRSSIVTNAYLFDENLIRTAKEEWHLQVAQVTLDGTEKVYNEAKAYVLPKDNPYHRVLRNIGALLDQQIAVSVRLNVTAKNAEDLSSLVDELADRFGGRKGFSAYAHAVYENVGFDPVSYDGDTREWVDIQTRDLEAKLRDKQLLGSLAKLPELHTTHCMADNDASRLIYPDGTVGKCENRSSLEGVGDIYRDMCNEPEVARYKAAEQIPGCSDCPMFPNCVNLKICPETGNCTRIKMEWRLDRYTELMRKRLQMYLQNASSAHFEEPGQPECGS